MSKSHNGSAIKKRWKSRRMSKDPHCYWCGEELVDTPHSGAPRHNFATIDHVYNRLHPHRMNGGQGRWVLACFWCNQERSKLDQKRYAKSEASNEETGTM